MKRKTILAAWWLSISFLHAGTQRTLSSSGSLWTLLTGGTLRAGSQFPMMTPGGSAISLKIEDFAIEDGYVALSGSVDGALKSEFILKGTRAGLYGWVALKDRDQAFQYTTDSSGTVRVEDVPLAAVYPVCDGPDGGDEGAPAPAPKLAASTPQVFGPEPHIGPYPGTDVRKLQSLPGAQKVLWMKMSRIMDGDTPMNWTKAQIWQIWQGFAAGYSMYKVNVTTDSLVWAAAGLKNSGIANMFNQTGTSSCGINAFGTNRGCTIYRKSSTTYSAGTLIHEVGHLLGLSHDGSPSDAYFGGLPTYKWCPIMGAHPRALKWNEDILWQFSKGEYASANQKQDDLALVGEHLDYRDDDIVGIAPLKLMGDSVSPLLNRGQIARNTDADSFSFQLASSGRTQLHIDRTEFIGGSMLDVDAVILDAAGKQVAHENPVAHRYADFDLTLPAGKYLLVVRGGAEGTPSQGFSKYSSLGFYAISGRLPTGFVSHSGTDGFDGSVRVSRLGASARWELRLPPGAGLRGITLTSVNGRQVFHTVERIATLDLSRFPAGLYGLRIDLEGGSVFRKIDRL